MKIEIGEEKEPIDWSKPQLVIGQDESVVLTTGQHEKDFFTGLQVGTQFYSVTFLNVNLDYLKVQLKMIKT